MKSSAPWSVKGIERDARETAKEAAKREGMTVGEWLNQLIYSAGGPFSSSGEIEGLKLRDIVTAIEHLHRRQAENNDQSAKTDQRMSRILGDVVDRLQRLERVKPAGGDAALMERMERLEGRGGDERIDALKALEKAVVQVGVQFSETQKASVLRVDAVERQMQELAARMDHVAHAESSPAHGDSINTEIAELAKRVARAEQLAEDAASSPIRTADPVDAEFVEGANNRLRVLGDEIKRSGDHIRGLEGTISKLSNQIEAAERRSAEAIEKVADTISDLRSEFAEKANAAASMSKIDEAIAAAAQASEERIGALENAVEEVVARLDARGAEDEEDSEPPRSEADRPFADVASEDFDGPKDDMAAFETGASAAPGESFAPPTPFKPEEPLGSDDDSDAEEDPFAFIDEIDASFDPLEAGEIEDDFQFDIDDGPDEAAPESKEDDDGQPVRAAPGDQDAHPQSDDLEADDELGAEIDVDAVLSEIGGFDGAGRPGSEKEADGEEDPHAPPPASPREDEPAAAQMRHALNIGQDEQQSRNRALLESANKRPLRRQLTPKQRAILAARARQKRAALEETGQARPARMPADSAKDAAPAQSEDPGAAQEEDAPSRLKQITALAAALGDKIPFISNKPTIETDFDVSNDLRRKARHGDRMAFETLKQTAAARPVMLALAVGLILAGAALFYLVRDAVFAPNREPAVIDVPPAPGEDLAAPESSLLETPAPPMVDPRALYLEAMEALNAGVGAPSEAIAKLEEAAALGHPPAQLQLGEFYKTGQGVEQDLPQARVWFRRAANGGNILAMHRIGVMMARGDGGPADAREAIDWFERAGNHGLVDSQYNLGAIYHPSEDSASSSVQDAGQAYYWYSLAVKNGDEQAAQLAKGIGALLSAEQKSALDESIAAWEAIPADEAANELAPAAG